MRSEKPLPAILAGRQVCAQWQYRRGPYAPRSTAAVGGERDWDYRYSWIRDAAFTVYGLMRVGSAREAERFMHWIEQRTHELGQDGELLDSVYLYNKYGQPISYDFWVQLRKLVDFVCQHWQLRAGRL